ncbi:MAG TPA: serine hydrolase domain-containing protein [Puia sp.]|nr:serine hydrolase domain-containing protein [Puia sp.]
MTDSIASIVRQQHIVGLMLGITTRDSVIFSGGFGYADLEGGRKVDSQTLFRMGSITKLFVSLGILKLVSEGKLRLNDELKRIAPEISFHNPWESRHPLLIIHLLEHTTGFDDVKLNRMYSLDTMENNGWQMALAQQPSLTCRWPPGERFAYSNPNYDILGYVIEKLTGQPYEKYLTENILIPLGMVHSNFNLRSKFPAIDTREYILRHDLAVQVPSVTVLSGPQGALWSNATEMLAFVRLFLRNGAPFFRAATIKDMEAPHSSLAARSGLTTGYGLGNENDFFLNFPYPFHGHDGLTGTCFSACKYNRELEVGFVLACNSNQDLHRIEALIVNYLENGHPPQPLTTQPLDVKALQPFLGHYQFESPRNEIAAFKDKLVNAPALSLRGGKLYYQPLLGRATELIQTAPLTFAWVGDNLPLIRLTRNESGKRVLLVAGAYYEKTSNTWALLKRTLLALALGCAASAMLSGLLAIVQLIAGKVRKNPAFLRILLMLGLVGLALAVSVLESVQEYSYRLSLLRTINLSTLTVFFGTLLFGAATLTCLLFSLFLYRKWASRRAATYFLLSSLSCCILLILLWSNGWIGLRTWAL